MSSAVVAQAASRFEQLHDKLTSRARAANGDLPPVDREDAVQEARCFA